MAIRLDIKLRLWNDDEIAMGPGKADLLDAIAATGSISAAARSMNMSYRRAWLLVDAMNRCFKAPLVRSAVGGQQGGGAQLTDTGSAVLRQFRSVQARASALMAAELAAFGPLLRDAPPAKVD